MMINNHYPYVKKGGTQGTGGTSGAAPMFACYPKIRVRNNRGNIVPSVFPEMFPVIIPQSRITRERFLCSPKNTHTGGFFYE